MIRSCWHILTRGLLEALELLNRRVQQIEHLLRCQETWQPTPRFRHDDPLDRRGFYRSSSGKELVERTQRAEAEHYDCPADLLASEQPEISPKIIAAKGAPV